MKHSVRIPFPVAEMEEYVAIQGCANGCAIFDNNMKV